MNLTISLLLILSSVLSFGQSFEGYSTDTHKSYHCLLQIKADSSIVFIYDRDKNGIYAEYVGVIESLTDSTFKIKATMAIGQFYMKSYNKDTLYIKLDSQIARTLDKIQVEYSNRKNRKLFQGYDSQGQAIALLKLPIDSDLFNSNKGTDYVEISVNRKNRITGEWVTFVIPFGSAAFITTGKEIEFELKWDGELIESIGQGLVQIGHIRLKNK